jgi:hypothetical protein
VVWSNWVEQARVEFTDNERFRLPPLHMTFSQHSKVKCKSGTRAMELTDHNSIKLEVTVADLTYPGRFCHVFHRVIKNDEVFGK